MDIVKVYTTKTCGQCPSVKKFLDLKRVKYEVVDITSDPAAGHDLHKRSGYTTVPIVEYKNKFVAGIQYGKLAELLQS